MNRHLGKAAGLRRLEMLLLSIREPILQAEAARRLGVNRSTIHRYLKDLGDEEVPVYEELDGRIAINRDAYLSNVRLTRHEAMALYLAARLLARYSDKPNAHTVEALLKLGVSLDPSAPQIGRHILRTSEALRAQLPGQTAEHGQRLEELTRAWSQGYKVRLRYRPLRSGRAFEETFSPYFLEPSAIGYSTYAIGRSDLVGKLRTRKLERIEQISPVDEPFEIPADFDPVKLLAGAWGIWFDEEDKPTTVKLKFSPAVARRVQESRWHPSQTVEPQAGGGLIWTAELDAVEEFVWWVRGWGAEVEVLEPDTLREEIIDHLRQAIALYNLPVSNWDLGKGDSQPMDVFQQFLTLPGKTEPQLTIFEHSGDVYQVALYLLAENKTHDDQHLLVKAGALLHDVGKIEQDIQPGKRWKHQPYSSKYLRPLIEHPRMKALLTDNQIDVNQVNYDDLLLICEHHHDIPTQPALLRRAPHALLVSVADVMASALEAGWLGEIRPMLTAGTYIDLNVSLMENLGLAGGLDGEIHRVDLPGDSTSDALLNDLIFRDMVKRLRENGLKPILQKRSSLWIVGTVEALRAFLKNYQVDPRGLYQSADLGDEVYEQILAQLPGPGALSADSLKYVLVNERIARKVALSLIDRKRVREALEHFDISIREVREAFGSRGRSVLDKLEAIGESPKYLLAGAQAAYRYHRWRLPSPGHFELLVSPGDFETWYAYLRDSQTYVGQIWPMGTERNRFAEVVLLFPELSEALWEGRVGQDGLALLSPTDLVFRLLEAGTEGDVAEAAAILVRWSESWDWDALGNAIEKQRIPRQMGCLLEIINYEAGREIVPHRLVERLAVRVRDTVGEARFIFPSKVGEDTPSATVSQEYAAIGRKWGLELRLATHIVAKVLDDLGV